jgi:hypothetical protein
MKAVGEPRPSAANGRPTRSPTPAAMDRTRPETQAGSHVDRVVLYLIPLLQSAKQNCQATQQQGKAMQDAVRDSRSVQQTNAR